MGFGATGRLVVWTPRNALQNRNSGLRRFGNLFFSAAKVNAAKRSKRAKLEHVDVGGFLSFIYLLCAGIRLARFNVITHPLIYPANIDRSNSDFIGLPVPAAAGIISTLVLVINQLDMQRWAIGLPFLMLFISYLMVSPIRYPSFKSVDWNTKVRLRTFILLLAFGAIIFMYRQYALVLLFIGYLIFGVVRHLLMLQRIRRQSRPAKPEQKSTNNS